MNINIVIVVVVTIAFSSKVSSKNILILLPIATKSHRNIIEPLVQALAKRDHNLTVISPGAPYSNAVANIKEIVPLKYNEVLQTFIDPFKQRREMGAFSTLQNMDYIYQASEKIYKSGLLEPFYEERFDLVIATAYLNRCFDCFMHKIGAPIIVVSQVPPHNYLTESIGNHLPPSFVPHVFLKYNDHMNFKQRFINAAVDMLLRVYNHMIFKPKLDTKSREFFGEGCPYISNIESNISLILSNSVVPLTTPRPLLPDVIEVGGMHCRPARPLPVDLDEFLSGSEHGFVYFSMGSVVQTDQMPDGVRQSFLNVFSRLKQRVIWKWNSGQMDNLPANVRVSKWLPQQDILGHPKIKVFMTHGGLLSTQEAAYHGVPLLGMPVFGDQDLNMNQAETTGYALTLEILEITEDKVETVLRKLIDDPKYSNKAKELSFIVRDQMQTPLERAVFWTEYVMRHNGALHLRSAARNLNYFQYRSLDIAALLLVISIVASLLMLAGCKFCFQQRKRSTVGDSTKKYQ